ncbi:MAG TPA: helix-turn-helix domain-containing protein [Cyclobacteriaceae bacterium]
MVDSKYLIDSRFLVDLQLHSVKDLLTGMEHHLEPRLMQVLLALLKNPGMLVSREHLIKEIWNDYAGAEEGLTQAISSLRKLLGDDSKDIIKTIPKKGYMLMSPVTKQHAAVTTTVKQKRYVPYVAVTGLVIIVSLVWLKFNGMNSLVTTSQPKTTEVAFPGAKETDESNYLNTITTTDSLGNHYRLVMIGDRRPKFYVNDTLANMELYTALIDNLAKELWRRQGEAEKSGK